MAEYQLVIPAGGRCLRMQGFGFNPVNKATDLKIGEETLLDRLIRQYYMAGVRRFVILKGASDTDIGMRYSVQQGIKRYKMMQEDKTLRVFYSHDPKNSKPGNAGAIALALQRGSIDPNLPMIVHNPDDLILSPDYPTLFMLKHEEYVRRGGKVTVVVVPEVPHPYSLLTMAVPEFEQVRTIQKGVYIPAISHVGVTLFEPKAFGLFDYVALNQDRSFESDVLPSLTDKGELYAIFIPSSEWLPINDYKQYLDAIIKILDLGIATIPEGEE